MSGNNEPAGGKNEQDDLDQYQAVQPDVAGMLGEERHVALESGDDDRLAGCGGQCHAPCGQRGGDEVQGQSDRAHARTGAPCR